VLRVGIAAALPGIAIAVAVALSGCGAIYQAHTEIRAGRMENSLQAGASSLDVRRQWGEPDIRTDVDDRTQVWSYAERPNSNDVTATMFYTAPKPGDKGRFLDLRFVDNKLRNWAEAERTMPPKESAGYGFGVGSGPASSPTVHY
jgi:uncharacterized protein YceK